MAVRSAQMLAVSRAKDRYHLKHIEKQSLESLPYSEPTVNPSDFKARKLEKTTGHAIQADADYRYAVETLAPMHERWVQDFGRLSSVFQSLEKERFQHLQTLMWSLSNLQSVCCVASDESNERVRIGLEKSSFDADLALVVDLRATGFNIPECPSYIPLPASTCSSISMGPASDFALDASSQMPRVRVRVLYQYDAQSRQELTMQPGQVIEVAIMHDDGWWEGSLENDPQRGLFPSNFTERI